jgi:hypothetical protein
MDFCLHAYQSLKNIRKKRKHCLVTTISTMATIKHSKLKNSSDYIKLLYKKVVGKSYLHSCTSDWENSIHFFILLLLDR